MNDLAWNELEVAPRAAAITAARGFAEALAKTEQFQAFEQAYIAFRQDGQAQADLQKLQDKQDSLKALIELHAVSEEEQKELLALQEAYDRHPTVMAYAQAQEALTAVAREMGDLLSKAIGLDYARVCRTGGCCGK